MQIELTGCTSAGKTTLMSRICRASHEQSLDVVAGDEFILGLVRLNGIRSHIARTLIIDFIAGIACLATIARHWGFYRFSLRLIFRLRTGWFERLNLARNALKKIGVFETIRRFAPPSKIVMVDEGTLHAAHNLFVHLNSEPSEDDFRTFLRLVPLPEAAVYLKESAPVLILRTHRRKHPRLRFANVTGKMLFVERAISTFERLESEPRVQQVLLIAEMPRRTLFYKAGRTMPPAVELAARITGAALAFPVPDGARCGTEKSAIGKARGFPAPIPSQ